VDKTGVGGGDLHNVVYIHQRKGGGSKRCTLLSNKTE